MEQTGPQVGKITNGISAESAEGCEMTVGVPALVAPKKSGGRARRSLENWLAPHLGMKPGACRDLALKILSGNIDGIVPRGSDLRKLLRKPDATPKRP